LYCPLDWGLGHASRGIFLIRKILDRGHRVTIAADNESLALLRKEFPDLKWIRFPSCRIRYSKKIPLVLKLLFSLPRIMVGIFREHQQLSNIISNLNIDVVISDNRYGLWNNKITTVFITHQISIRLPRWIMWFEYPLYKLNRAQIQKFSYLWIPDEPEENNLSGDLVRKYPLPVNARFIGIISRFATPGSFDELDSGRGFEILVILSGPEPQRSILEALISQQLKGSKFRTLMVRGMPSKPEKETKTGNVTMVSHLPSVKLRNYIINAKFIICRPGYSTIMDLIVLGKTALLIPTPGQTEQEYLGYRMHEKKLFMCMQQNELHLEQAFSELGDSTIRFALSVNLPDKAFDEISL